MKLFRVFSVKENKYITETNEWMVDIEGHICSLHSDSDLTTREDCLVEWNTGYVDHRGHQIYEGDVFFDTENNFAMVAIWHENMWVLQVWGYSESDIWEELDMFPMDDFEFDDYIIAGNYHYLGNELYKGAKPDDILLR